MKNQNMKTLLALSALSLAILIHFETASAAPKTEVQTFSTPDQAVEMLTKAASTYSIEGLRTLFGSENKDLLSSGDPVSDQAGLTRFTELFNEEHSLEPLGEGKMALIIGKEEWPFPVPLVKGEAGWSFDVDEGQEEIINRRIGRNELNAISVAHAFVDAQHEYAEADRDGDGFKEFAKVFISAHGRRNGLFWPRKQGEAPSPFGPFLARAADDGYRFNKDKPVPYYGYLFKILDGQGAQAPGGAKSYITQGGRMTEGFALLAYPVNWGASGIMSFIVSQEGVVYEKNLGPSTEKAAHSMKLFNPDSSWKKVE